MTTPSGVPAVEMAHAVASYQAMLFTLRRFDDTTARDPSLLPSWTRAHVVAHLARNADSHRRMLEGVMRGDVVSQYPGGPEGRSHEIELSSRQPAEELATDFRRASEDLFGVWEAMPDQLWDEPTAWIDGTRPARETVWARWRELEVHHADLDLGFGPEHWPRGFVTIALPRTIAGLPGRRMEASLSPDQVGTWLLQCTHGIGEWLVLVAAERTETREAQAAEEHDVCVRGPGWAILFWLLGRAALADLALEVTDDLDRAGSLPTTHPYP